MNSEEGKKSTLCPEYNEPWALVSILRSSSAVNTCNQKLPATLFLLF